VNIDVLYFEGCPNHEPTVALVRDVARELGVDVVLREVHVRSPEDAERFRFLGSPTVQVGGVDIEPARREDSQFAMACRVYGESGVPPRSLVAAAIREKTA